MKIYESKAGGWVYDELRERIVSLDFKPGKIIQQNHLCEEMGISRSPLRDALLRLQRDRLVEIIPQKETRVSLLDRPTILEERFLRSTVESRVLDACLALMERDRLVEDQVLADLKSSLIQQEVCLKKNDPADFLHQDGLFHQVFYRALGYERIYTIVSAHTGNELRIRLLNFKTGAAVEEVYREHEKIVAALEAHDGSLARRLLEDHLEKLNSEMDILTDKYPSYFTERSGESNETES